MLNRLKGFLYDCTGLLARLRFRKKTSQKLLIVRVDEIGDYMLWRPFFHELVSADRFKDHEIHFCGNSSWKPIFDSFDADKVHQSIWLQKVRFKKDLLYRYRFLKNIYRQGYSVIINPTFSRDKRNDDAIVVAAGARQTIGMVANKETIRNYETGYDKKLYTELFELAEKPVFEFHRNRLFTEFVTGKPSLVHDTKIDADKLPAIGFELPEKYFVVFPGSRSQTRIWPAASFAAVSKFLFENYGWAVVICGGPGDLIYAETFAAAYTGVTIDLTAKTSLPELMTVLKKAQLLLSVDTGSVHLAAATGCTVFGIFNGSQYGRFAPYAKNIAPNFYAIYPDNVEEDVKNNALIKQKYEFVVNIPYSSVVPEKIIHSIHKHLTP